MRHIRYSSLAICCVILASCGVAGDYYVFERESHTTLYKGENIFVHLSHFDGNISTITIYQQNREEPFDFRVIEAHQSLSVNNTQIQSETRNDTKSVLEANPESSVLLQITEVYQPGKPFERVTEKVDVELLVNDKPIIISKEFPLKRVTYNRIQALWGI